MNLKFLSPSRENISIFPILVVNFIGALGFGVVLPFLVYLVTKFGGNAPVYGLLGAIYPLFQLIGGPILGKWSDIYGRKKVLLLSQGGTVIGWIIFYVAFYLPATLLFKFSNMMLGTYIITIPILVLFIARAVDGITGGNISVANAYLSDISSDKDRSKNFGKMSVASNLGFIFGPALAALLGSTVYAEKLPVLATLAISIFAVIVIAVFLKDTGPKSFINKEKKSEVKKLLGCETMDCFKKAEKTDYSFKKVMSLPGITFSIIIYFLIFLGFNFFYTAFPVHVVQSLGWDLTTTGIFFSVLSLLLVVVEGPLLTYLSKHVKDLVLIIGGNIILSISFVLLLSKDLYVIFSSSIFFALGNGLMWPSFLSLLSRISGNKYQGSVQGIASSAGSLASIIGLIAGGVLYATLREFTFIIAAIIIFLVSLISFRFRKIERNLN